MVICQSYAKLPRRWAPGYLRLCSCDCASIGRCYQARDPMFRPQIHPKFSFRENLVTEEAPKVEWMCCCGGYTRTRRYPRTNGAGGRRYIDDDSSSNNSPAGGTPISSIFSLVGVFPDVKSDRRHMHRPPMYATAHDALAAPNASLSRSSLLTSRSAHCCSRHSQVIKLSFNLTALLPTVTDERIHQVRLGAVVIVHLPLLEGGYRFAGGRRLQKSGRLVCPSEREDRPALGVAQHRGRPDSLLRKKRCWIPA